MDYDKDTRLAYDGVKAAAYHRQQTQKIGWIRFTTWRMRVCTRKALSGCELPAISDILDIPCGTGVMAPIINRFVTRVVASDISTDMMKLGRNVYVSSRFRGFVQSDITHMPFRENTFDCVLVIALMHRLPEEIRRRVYDEVGAVSKKYVIVSYSIDSVLQRLKQRLIRCVIRFHKSAPLPLSLKAITNEIEASGLKIKKRFTLVPFLSASVVFLLEKR